MSTVLNNLGYALMRRERPRDAALIYTLALRVHPGSAATLANLALACGARAWCGACVTCLVLAVRGSRDQVFTGGPTRVHVSV